MHSRSACRNQMAIVPEHILEVVFNQLRVSDCAACCCVSQELRALAKVCPPSACALDPKRYVLVAVHCTKSTTRPSCFRVSLETLVVIETKRLATLRNYSLTFACVTPEQTYSCRLRLPSCCAGSAESTLGSVPGRLAAAGIFAGTVCFLRTDAAQTVRLTKPNA